MSDLPGYSAVTGLPAGLTYSKSKGLTINNTENIGLIINPNSFKTEQNLFDSGQIVDTVIPNLSAEKITTGLLSTSIIPNIDASKITSGNLALPIDSVISIGPNGGIGDGVRINASRGVRVFKRIESKVSECTFGEAISGEFPVVQFVRDSEIIAGFGQQNLYFNKKSLVSNGVFSSELLKDITLPSDGTFSIGQYCTMNSTRLKYMFALKALELGKSSDGLELGLFEYDVTVPDDNINRLSVYIDSDNCELDVQGITTWNNSTHKFWKSVVS